MLITNVSLARRRAIIAASVVEAATALDDSTTGNVVFATLIDDPASVLDLVDAYVGEIMLEPANATDSFDAGSSYSVAVDETGFAVAADTMSFPQVLAADVAEAAGAAASQDWGGVPPVTLSYPVLSASRAGAGSVVVTTGTGETQIISNIGAVT